MARLNSRSSAIAAGQVEAVVLAPGDISDLENQDPKAKHVSKHKRRVMQPSPTPPSGLPTPGSDTSESSRGTKRKRIQIQPAGTLPSMQEDEGADERKFNRYYNPDQDLDERRQVTRQSRALEREFNEKRDEYLGDGGADRLKQTVSRADHVFRTIKQTTDATVDSRLLVNVSDLAFKKSTQLALGDNSTGIDVDVFLSKCITFMQSNGTVDMDDGVTSTQPQRRRRYTQDGDGDEDVTGELDWAVLGQHACFPYNARPPVPSFLLGPLSVQKKQRTLTQRRARQAKDNANREARPEALTHEDLSQSDENSLTAICKRIRMHLEMHIQRADQAAAALGLHSEAEIDGERARDFFRKYRVSSTGGPSLFDYVVNPNSFGQTVENMFYVSFLVKEGVVGVFPDEDGLPTLLASKPRSLEEQRMENVQKHQAVFAIDYVTWQELIQAFDIREPLIPHREEESATQIGARGCASCNPYLNSTAPRISQPSDVYMNAIFTGPPLIFLNTTGACTPTGRNVRVQARTSQARLSNPTSTVTGSFGSFGVNLDGRKESNDGENPPKKRLKRTGQSRVRVYESQGKGPAGVFPPSPPLRILSVRFERSRLSPAPNVNLEDVLQVAAFHIRRTAAQMLFSEPERALEALRCRQWCSVSTTFATLGRTTYLDSAIACVISKVQQVITGRKAEQRTLRCYADALHDLRAAVLDPTLHNLPDMLAASQLLAVYEMLDFPNNGTWAQHVSGAAAMAKLQRPGATCNALRSGQFVEALLNNDPEFFDGPAWKTLMQTMVTEQQPTSDLATQSLSCFAMMRSVFADARAAARDNAAEMDWPTRLSLLSRAHEVRCRMKQTALRSERRFGEARKASKDFDALDLFLVIVIMLDRLILSLRPSIGRGGHDLQNDTRELCTQLIRLEMTAYEENPGKDLLRAFQQQVRYPLLIYDA